MEKTREESNEYIVWKLVDYIQNCIHGESVKQLLKKDDLLWNELRTRLE